MAENLTTAISSKTKTVEINRNQPTVIIGERINPTGRKYINSTFIAMAIQAGLTCPITNPLVLEVSTAILAVDLTMGRDEYGMRWIQVYRERQKAAEGG